MTRYLFNIHRIIAVPDKAKRLSMASQACRLGCAVAVCVMWLSVQPAHAAQSKVTVLNSNIVIAGIQVAVWAPDKPVTPSPVIIFSHGFHECRDQSVFLMRAFAKAGYTVFAPNHKDSHCSVLPPPDVGPVIPLALPAHWNDKTYRDRYLDIKNMLDTMAVDPRFKDLDLQHIGMAGHSLGGYTALAMAGAWPHWKDNRIRAVLVMSPYSAPFVFRHTLHRIRIPVMYQGGTMDPDFTPFVSKYGGAYNQTTAPKMYLEMDGAEHMSWTDNNPKYEKFIRHYGVAFFDTVLKGKPFPEKLKRTNTIVTRFWFDLINKHPDPVTSFSKYVTDMSDSYVWKHSAH